MKSVIGSWFGRTGNNFIQVINCIYYSFYLNNFEEIQFPNHPLLMGNSIKNQENKSNDTSNKMIKNNFFYAKKLGFRLHPCQMREIAQKYIINIVNLNLDKEGNEDDLYIHVRGGDSMSNYNFQLQNPLKLYKIILTENNYEKIIIVYEDTHNPIIEYLKRLNHPKLYFQSSSIKNDIETLCQAKNFLMCLSTFDLMIYYLSKNISHILIPQFMIDEWYPDMKWNIPMTIFSFENYTIEMWKKMRYNEKRHLLINYDGEILKNHDNLS